MGVSYAVMAAARERLIQAQRVEIDLLTKCLADAMQAICKRDYADRKAERQRILAMLGQPDDGEM